MQFRSNMTIEVDLEEDGLAVKTPVELQLVYQSGGWRALAKDPPISTDMFDTMEKAIVAAARSASKRIESPV